MLNTEKLKKRFYIFLAFYFLFGTTIYFLFDSAVSPDFTRQYKIILFVLEVVYFDLPLVLALVLNNVMLTISTNNTIHFYYTIKISILSVFNF